MIPTTGDGDAVHDEAAPAVVTLDVSRTSNVVHVFGDVDRASVGLLDDVVERAGAGRPLVIDFTHCRYLDSSVLSALVRTRNARTEALRVVLPENHRMRRVFTITNLDAILAIVPDLDAANRSIRAARPRMLRSI